MTVALHVNTTLKRLATTPVESLGSGIDETRDVVTGWIDGRMDGRLVGCFVDWMVGCLLAWLAYGMAG